MKSRHCLALGGALVLAGLAAPLGAQDGGQDDAQIARIVDEGMNRSQVQATAHDLLDRIGRG